jgi:hypothetical protein
VRVLAGIAMWRGRCTEEIASLHSKKDAIGIHANANVTVPTIVTAIKSRVSVVEEEVGEHAKIAKLTGKSMDMGDSYLTSDVSDFTAVVIAMVPTVAFQQDLDLFVDNVSEKSCKFYVETAKSCLNR